MMTNIYDELREQKQSVKIKDSGNRTEFSTGAVRDMHEGKGRCDLLPPLALMYSRDSGFIGLRASYGGENEKQDSK